MPLKHSPLLREGWELKEISKVTLQKLLIWSLWLENMNKQQFVEVSWDLFFKIYLTHTHTWTVIESQGLKRIPGKILILRCLYF